MKREICEQRPFCDVCEKEAVYGCAGCDVDTCLTCRDETFIAYIKNFNLDSSSIFPVCKKCDAKPSKELKPMLSFVKKVDKKVKAELKRREETVKTIHDYAKENYPK